MPARWAARAETAAPCQASGVTGTWRCRLSALAARFRSKLCNFTAAPALSACTACATLSASSAWARDGASAAATAAALRARFSAFCLSFFSCFFVFFGGLPLTSAAA